MSKEIIPQCQARQKNGTRCPKPAKYAISISGKSPCFVCGIHAKEDRKPASWVSEEIDATSLPTDLLEQWLMAWREYHGAVLVRLANIRACEREARHELQTARRELQSRRGLGAPGPMMVDEYGDPLGIEERAKWQQQLSSYGKPSDGNGPIRMPSGER